jgi:hypothetical protein
MPLSKSCFERREPHPFAEFDGNVEVFRELLKNSHFKDAAAVPRPPTAADRCGLLNQVGSSIEHGIPYHLFGHAVEGTQRRLRGSG